MLGRELEGNIGSTRFYYFVFVAVLTWDKCEIKVLYFRKENKEEKTKNTEKI